MHQPDIRQALTDAAPDREDRAAAAATRSARAPAARQPARARPGQTVQACRTQDGVQLAMTAIGQAPRWCGLRPGSTISNTNGTCSSAAPSTAFSPTGPPDPLRRPRQRALRPPRPGVPFAAFEHDLEAVVDARNLSATASWASRRAGPLAIAHAVRFPERVTRAGARRRPTHAARNRRGVSKDCEIRAGPAHADASRLGRRALGLS